MIKLRFAPIIRVSTEKQEQKGESLKTQTSQIIQYVKALDGAIPEYCWQYKGQEQATPNQERLKLDKLLTDASKDLFDAVIVCDASRWSRDNARSKAGLEILRSNGIKFFIGTMEYDLYNPAQNLFLGMSAEIGEFQALEQARKSITNRIHRAERGIPTVGQLPFGRTYDKEICKWGIDEEKQNLIQSAVKRYIKGERMIDIANSVGIHPISFFRILKGRLGSEWEISFVNKKVNVNETVIMKIPPLIDDPKILNAVKERMRSNTLYVRGHRKYSYILSGYLFCARCGSKMQGSTNRHGRFRRYYFHWRKGNNGCKFRKMINGPELENSILLSLVATFGDYEKIQNAIQKAIPDIAQRNELNNEFKTLTKELTNILKKKDILIGKIANELITDEEAEQCLKKLRDQEEPIKQRLAVIETELSNTPDPEGVQRLSKLAVKVISDATRKNPKLIFKRSEKWKRGLIEKAFSGVDSKGQRLGIYVDYDENGNVKYEIRGLFETTVNSLPMDDEQLMNVFNFDPQYQDVQEELKSIRLNLQGI
jgi:site-specific DNA recombinase